jgi:hypothetical protein
LRATIDFSSLSVSRSSATLRAKVVILHDDAGSPAALQNAATCRATTYDKRCANRWSETLQTSRFSEIMRGRVKSVVLLTTARRIGQADQWEAGSPAGNDCPVGQSLRSHQ